MDEHRVLEQVAQLIARHRIRVYKLPRFKQSALHNKAGQAFCFYKGPEHYLGIETRPRFFPNRNEADTFIATLDAKAAFWHKCLQDNGVLPDNVSPQKTSDAEYRNIVSELLVSRQLLLYETYDAPLPPKGEQTTESVSADEPGNRKAHLITPIEPSKQAKATQGSDRTELIQDKIDFPEISVTTKINGNEVSGLAKPVDIRVGDSNKIAIIGRSMDAVEPYADALRAKGLDVNVFSSKDLTVPTYARKQWDLLRTQYNGRIPDHILPETQMFKANEGWAELIKYDN